MTFNLPLDDQTATELDQAGETRSGMIRKALRVRLDKQTLDGPGWPSLILAWQGYRGSAWPREHRNAAIRPAPPN